MDNVSFDAVGTFGTVYSFDYLYKPFLEQEMTTLHIYLNTDRQWD